MTLNILSCGIGVQSTTILLMSKHGDLPVLDAAIFADTANEPKAVYKHLEWVQQEAALPFPLYITSIGNLMEDNLRLIPSKNPESGGKPYLNNSVPMYIRNQQNKMGQMIRRCTLNFKIIPVRKKVMEILGKDAIKKWKKEQSQTPLAKLWMGISLDESLRMKQSLVPWMENEYPLIDRRMTRGDCLTWLRTHNYPTPPKSSCIMCPFHSDNDWLRLKNDSPTEFAEAVQWEKDMQGAATQSYYGGKPFCHPSLQPLEKVNFRKRSDWHQGNLWSPFTNACDEGYCGL